MQKKINKIYIIIILMNIYLNWNFNFLEYIGIQKEYFNSFLIYNIFLIIYPILNYTLKISYYIFTIIYISYNIILSLKIKKIYSKIIFIFFFLLIVIFQIKYITFSRSLYILNIISLFFFSKYLYKNKVYQNKKIINLILFNLFLQYLLLNFRGRRTLSWIDPNFAGYYLFLIYIIIDLVLKKRIIKLLIVFSAIFITSRSFFLSLIIYELIGNKKQAKFMIKVLEKLKMKISSLLLILFTIILFIFSEFYIENIKAEYSYKEGISRLVSFNDNSNNHRFIAILNFCKNVKENSKLRNIGMTGEEYQRLSIYSPHNGFLALIKKYGIYLGGIGGIISFQLIFFKLNNKNIAYFLSLLFYQLFLGIPFEGASLLILAYINALCINDRSIKKRRKINKKSYLSIKNESKNSNMC